MSNINSTEQLPEEFLNFDSLPNLAQVRRPVVQRLFGISRPTVWRWINKGLLPKPNKVCGFLAWNVGDLREHLALMTCAHPQVSQARVAVSASSLCPNLKRQSESPQLATVPAGTLDEIGAVIEEL